MSELGIVYANRTSHSRFDMLVVYASVAFSCFPGFGTSLINDVLLESDVLCFCLVGYGLILGFDPFAGLERGWDVGLLAVTRMRVHTRHASEHF